MDKEVQELENEINYLVQPYREEIELLDTIPGMGTDAAASILAEIGPDLSQFPSDAQLSSWAGVCPANHISNGKKQQKEPTRE